MKDAAIVINDVRKSFDATRALKGVSFNVAQGEFFGLLGPNGAGKSTLINIIAGLAHASSGTVSVLGHDVVGAYRKARKNLGVVPQELVYDPFFPVLDLLRLQAGYYGCGREVWPWIDELLTELDLDDKRDQSMRALSGGMKRRVLIAQALVHKPQVIILDEPTAGVDVELRRTLWRFTRRLHKAGHTIVLTTHYLEEAEALCDRIAILHHGKLRVLEEKHTLLERYPFRFLKLDLQGDGSLPDAVRALAENIDGGHVELKLEQGKHAVAEVLDAIRAAGLHVRDVHIREPSLEDVFVELTNDAKTSQAMA